MGAVAVIAETVPVGVRAAGSVTVDGYGQQEVTYAPAVRVLVVGVAPRDGTAEPYVTAREAVTHGVAVYSYQRICGARDRLVWPFPGGTEYDVDGEPSDYRHGPWGDGVAGVVTFGKYADG